MKDLLFRLILDNKVVGYEYHHQRGHSQSVVPVSEYFDCGQIYHSKDGKNYCNILDGLGGDIPHDSKEQFTGYLDFDKKMIYDNDDIEIESGRSFVGGKFGDKTRHHVKWDSAWGGWCMFGIDVKLENGEPSINLLTEPWVDGEIVARAYPLRTLGRAEMVTAEFDLVLKDNKS